MVTKTFTAAKERARKTSVTVFGASAIRKVSNGSDSVSGMSNSASRQQMDYGHDNNNFVIDVTDSHAEDGITDIERNVKLRMQKRDELMRWV